MAKECNNTSCDKASCEGCSSSKKQQSFQAEMNAGQKSEKKNPVLPEFLITLLFCYQFN